MVLYVFLINSVLKQPLKHIFSWQTDKWSRTLKHFLKVYVNLICPRKVLKMIQNIIRTFVELIGS